MAEEIPLEKISSEDEQGLLRDLEEKVHHLLIKFHEMKEEKDRLTMALEKERERVNHLEKELKLLLQDRERVKTRIDQLLHRFRGLDT